MEWLQLIIGFIVGGGSMGIAGFFTIKSTIRKATIDADKAADDRYREQIDHQQQTVDKLLGQVDSFAQRLSAQNAALDKQIDRNRELSDRLWHSEQGLNAEKDRVAALLRENGTLKRINDFLQRWHCRRPFSECRRREPEQKVKEAYMPPDELIALAAANETLTNDAFDNYESKQ